jgi:predicted tellurium resistance membrane protein TerC
MTEATKRSIFRWIHLIFAIPIIGYIYSPFKELPNYAPVVRYVAIPVIALTGLWMWKGHLLRRLISKNALDTLVTATDLHDYLNSYIDLL